MIPKMDRTAARNVRDLERKYRFGKRFNDVEKEAEAAKEETEVLIQKVTDLEVRIELNTSNNE